jgi:hypothetical protein
MKAFTSVVLVSGLVGGAVVAQTDDSGAAADATQTNVLQAAQVVEVASNAPLIPIGPTRLSLRPGLGMTPRFEQLDANGDGRVSFEEFSRYNLARYTPELFAQMDVDASDTLEIAELAAAGERHILSMLDADGDGILTRAEFLALEERLEAAFATWDKDGDGYLTQQELPVLKRRFGKRRNRNTLVQ